MYRFFFSSFVAPTNPGGWQKVISRLKLDPSDLLSQHTSDLLHAIHEGMTEQKDASRSALLTLLKYEAAIIVPKIVDNLCELLGNTDLLGVTEEMMEIMYTPQGQLWHQGLLKE